MGFVDDFESKFKEAVNGLINSSDNVLVAVSGGKDSMTVLYLLNKLGYKVTAFYVDLLMGDYSMTHLRNITGFCEELSVPLRVVSVREELGSTMCYVRGKVQSVRKLSNCYVCGVIKRSLINKYARTEGFTKVVTGHNRDDFIESVFMNLIMGNPSLCISGVSSNDLFIPRVKPLNDFSEVDIRKYSLLKGLPVNYDSCPCSGNAFRRFIKGLISDWDQDKFINYYNELIKGASISRGDLVNCKSCGEPCSKGLCAKCKVLKS